MKTRLFTLLFIAISTAFFTSCSFDQNPVAPYSPCDAIAKAQKENAPIFFAPPAPLPEETIEYLRLQVAELKAEIRALKAQLHGATINVVDINSASSAQLQTLPGIGPVTARKILQFRIDNGGFQTPDQLLDVSGIGPATLENIRPLLSANDPPLLTAPTDATFDFEVPSPSKKLNINTASAAELESLNGIGPAKAAAILAYRAINGNFETVNQLTRVKGIGIKTLNKFIHLITV